MNYLCIIFTGVFHPQTPNFPTLGKNPVGAYAY